MKKRSKLLALLLTLVMLLTLVPCGTAGAEPPEGEETKEENAPDPVILSDPLVAELLGEDAEAILPEDFSSPLDYYRAVEQRRNAELLGALLGARAEGEATLFSEGELALRLDQSVLEPELLALLADALQMDLDWARELSLHFLNGSEGLLSQTKAVLRLNGTDIIHADLTMDLASFTEYITVPELNESAFSLNLQEQLEESGLDLNLEEYVALIRGLTANPERITDLLQRYELLVTDELGEVLLREETLSAGDVTCPCTVAELRVDSEDMLRIAGACLDAAAEDKELEELIYAFLHAYGQFSGSEEDFSAAYQEGIQNLQDQLKDTTPEDLGIAVVMNVFIDAKGEILGRRVEIFNESERVLLLSLLSARDGDKLGVDGEFGIYLKSSSADGSYRWENQNVVRLSGGGSYSPEGQLSGEFALDYCRTEEYNGDREEEELPLGSLKLEGKIGRGGFLGEALFTPSTEVLDLILEDLDGAPEAVERLVRSLSLALVNRSADGKFDFSTVLRSKGSDLLTLQISAQPTEPFAISVPTETVDLETWQESIGITNLNDILNSLKAAGVPDALLNSLTN